jgi:ribosomal protein S18 acetylase RimI-like enzyme
LAFNTGVGRVNLRTVVHRRPYDHNALGALVTFASRHPVNYRDEATFRHSVSQLVSGPAAVVDLFAGDERVAVVVILDRLGTPSDWVLAVLIAARPTLDWEAALEIVLDSAHTLAAAAQRSTVAVTCVEPLPPGMASVLAARRQRLFMREHRMERIGPAPIPAPLERGWRWEDVDQPGRQASIRLLQEAFAGSPLFLPPEEEMGRSLFTGDHRARLLLDGERPAGFVRVMHDPLQRLGYVGPIGRHPSYRGRRLGDRLLTECLSLLAARACDRVCLDVVATNATALRLYERHGFVTRRQIGYYAGHR